MELYKRLSCIKAVLLLPIEYRPTQAMLWIFDTVDFIIILNFWSSVVPHRSKSIGQTSRKIFE